MIGANAAATRDVPAGATVVGADRMPEAGANGAAA
jgi:acetyltransferase-like isoleucine patch superfamily enzyme